MVQRGVVIPAPYRAFFLFLEPISAIAGAICALYGQDIYLSLTAHSSTKHFSSIEPVHKIVLYQLSNLYLFFAINEALVLRSSRDLRVWRTVLFGLLVADLGHLYSVSPLGVSIYYQIWRWNVIDWGNIGFVYLGGFDENSIFDGFGLVPYLYH